MWTHEHLVTLLPAVGVYLIIALVLWLLLRNKSEIIRLIPTMIIGVALFVLEAIKQIYNIRIGYTYWILPFHFCSQYFWMVPLMAFYQGKHKYLVRAVVTNASMMMFLFLMLYPQSIYGAGAIRTITDNFSSFHAVVFHNLVVLNLFIVIALNVNKFKAKRDIIANVITFTIYCIVGGVMAQVLKTNYNNFYRNIVKMIDDIRLAFIANMGNFGQYLYVILFSILIVIGSVISYFILRLVCKIFNHKPKLKSTEGVDNK